MNRPPLPPPDEPRRGHRGGLPVIHNDDDNGCPVGRACLGCGITAAALAPACTGALDLCGAPAGEPCEPGCPSLASEGWRTVLDVAVFSIAAEALCLTLCASCAATRRLPRLTTSAAMRLAIEHREHNRGTERAAVTR